MSYCWNKPFYGYQFDWFLPALRSLESSSLKTTDKLYHSHHPQFSTVNISLTMLYVDDEMLMELPI